MGDIIGLDSLTLTAVLMYATAVYYFTVVATEEDGPLGIFIDLRLIVGMRITYYSETAETWITERPTRSGLQDVKYDYSWCAGDGFWSKVLACHRCTAPYTAVILLPILLFAPLLLLPFSAAGAVIIFKESING